jgi:hypothetical protein
MMGVASLSPANRRLLNLPVALLVNEALAVSRRELLPLWAAEETVKEAVLGHKGAEK